MVIDYKLHLSLKDIHDFVKGVLAKLEPLQLHGDNLFAIRLSLEEALINAVKHGNKLDKNKKIFLKIDAGPKLLEIEMKDEGLGFDYKNIPLPTDEENITKPSGRGIFLINKAMDKVEFFDGGSRIKLTKYLKPEGARP